MYLDEVDSGLQAQQPSLRMAFLAHLQAVASSLQTQKQRLCDDRSKLPALQHTRMHTWQGQLDKLNQAWVTVMVLLLLKAMAPLQSFCSSSWRKRGRLTLG